MTDPGGGDEISVMSHRSNATVSGINQHHQHHQHHQYRGGEGNNHNNANLGSGSSVVSVSTFGHAPAVHTSGGSVASGSATQHVPSGSVIQHVPSGTASISGGASVGSHSLAHHRQPIGKSPLDQGVTISLDSPLPPAVLRSLGDRSYDKRKNAALEIESLVKSLQESNNHSPLIHSVIAVLAKDFSTSMNAQYRKGGLIGLAATAIGLMGHTSEYLDVLLPPVLHCFDDPESRVRYYACESLYNIAKVARTSILRHFNPIFEGLCKLFADVDVDVKNGATLLDRLVKDIVTESENFNVEMFIPLLQNYIRRTNPYIRQLLVGWITVLDSVPDINMIDWLPDFLDGLFNMLSDSNREIRQAADSALSDFLREVKESSVVDFGPMVAILVMQSNSKERLNRLIASTWISEFIHLGGDKLLPFHSDILGAVMRIISDEEVEIRQVAELTNNDLLQVVKDTENSFELPPLLATLTEELMSNDMATKMASLRWINMLLEKRPNDMNAFISDILPVLLKALSDPSDPVVLLNLQVLSRISLHKTEFQLVLNAVLGLFAKDRNLLEARGSLIVRKFCVLLNAKSVYIRMSDVISNSQEFSLAFKSTMIQTLNLILLTAPELHELRALLKRSFEPGASDEDRQVFVCLFNCWCHNPVATFALCLLAQAYDVSYALIKKFTNELEVTVGILMQVDKLVMLLESPVFCHLRLQMLDVEAPYHTSLLKACYGLLMMLPQSDAFRMLNERLATVCNLRDNLSGAIIIQNDDKQDTHTDLEDTKTGSKLLNDKNQNYEETSAMDSHELLMTFDEIMVVHKKAKQDAELRLQSEQQQQQQLLPEVEGAPAVPGSPTSKTNRVKFVASRLTIDTPLSPSMGRFMPNTEEIRAREGKV